MTSTPLSPEQLHIIQHSLGCDEYGQTTYRGRDEGDGCSIYHRNHFQTGSVGADGQVCESLVVLGYMAKGKRLDLTVYWVTAEGMEAMRRESPPPPKLTRGQKRYRAWRRFDGDISFIDWCRWMDLRKKEGLENV